MLVAQIDHVIVGDIQMRARQIDLACIGVNRIEGENHGCIEFGRAGQRFDKLFFDLAFGGFVVADHAQSPSHEAERQRFQQAIRRTTMRRRHRGNVNVGVENHPADDNTGRKFSTMVVNFRDMLES